MIKFLKTEHLLFWADITNDPINTSSSANMIPRPADLILKMVGSILEVVLVKLMFSSPDNRLPLPWFLQKLGWLVYIPAYSLSFDRDYFSTLMEHSLGLTC